MRLSTDIQELASPDYIAHLSGPLLGFIDADFDKQVFLSQIFSRSTSGSQRAEEPSCYFSYLLPPKASKPKSCVAPAAVKMVAAIHAS